MKILSLSAEVILTIGGLFTSLAFADSNSIITDSDSASVVDSAPAPPVSVYTPCAASCDECNSGCLSAAPNCGFCAACGNADCNGLCDSCIPQGCTANFFGNLKKTLCKGVRWSGYINAGYDTNFSGDLSNGLVDAWNNTTPTLNGVYVSAEKKTFTGGYGFDVGYRVDLMFGEDARIFRSARGLDQDWVTGHMYNANTGEYNRPSYGFAMPYLYVETAINNWSVQAGHFKSLVGYEGAPAPKRFFYTKGLISSSSQTGFLATYNGLENLDITLGWVNGWNNEFDNSKYNDGMMSGSFTYRINPTASIKWNG